MKKLLVFLAVLVTSITIFGQIFAQGFQPPSPGKAVVYFVRASNYFKNHIEHFYQDKYIGNLPRNTYLRYECDPGEQLFWANSETGAFITADLKENETYLVITYVAMGVARARVIFDPINSTEKRFAEIKAVINSKPPNVTPQDKIDERNKKLTAYIPEQLKRYDDAKAKGQIFKHISPDMAIPADAMK